MPSSVADRLTRGRDFSVYKSVQTAKGTINASPVLVPYRRTSGKPNVTIGYTTDDTVTNDNQGQQNIQDTKEFTTEIASSFSKQSVLLMIEAIHAGQVVYTLTNTTTSSDATGFTVAAAAYAALSVGDGFWISGFATASINGFYIVKTKDASNHISTTIAPAAVEAAGASVTIKSNKSKNADLPTYNLMQRQVPNLSETAQISYLSLYDSVVDTFSMEIGETGIVQSNAAFVSDRRVEGTLPIAGQTIAAPLTDRSLSAVLNVAGFYLNGLSATCDQKSMSIEIANGYAKDDAAGCSPQWARGQFAVSGSMSFRSRISNTLQYEAIYQNSTLVQIGVRVTHGGGDETYITLPQVVFTEHSQADGSNDVAASEISFGAEGNAAFGGTIGIYTNWV
jgi:hypothetical protein